MNKRLVALQQQYQKEVAGARAILDSAEGRDLTAEETKAYEAHESEMTRIESAIDREKKLEELDRKAAPVFVIESEEEKKAKEAKVKAKEKRFGTFGDQLRAIANAGMNRGASYDDRLVYQAASGASESVPSEGGFLVQTDFSNNLLTMMHDMGEVVSRVERLPLSAGSNGFKLPFPDETSRVNGSRFGGVQSYWADEAATVTATKPKFGLMELALHKLFGLSYATEELLQDAAALGRIMSLAFSEEMTFKTEDAIINGTGAGQPLGILNSGALVTVAKETSQTAATVVTANVLKMFSRMPQRSRTRAVWLINQDVEQQLYSLTLGSGTAVILLYTPPGTNGNKYGMLLGRPVIPVEYCATLGTAGDIVFADLGSYATIDKGGVQENSSMHVRFIYDEMTFRTIFRVDGQPLLKSPITPYKGSNTQSPFIALAVRA